MGKQLHPFAMVICRVIVVGESILSNYHISIILFVENQSQLCSCRSFDFIPLQTIGVLFALHSIRRMICSGSEVVSFLLKEVVGVNGFGFWDGMPTDFEVLYFLLKVYDFV